MVHRFLRDSDMWTEICVDRKRQPPKDLIKEKFCIKNGGCKISEPGESEALNNLKNKMPV